MSYEKGKLDFIAVPAKSRTNQTGKIEFVVS